MWQSDLCCLLHRSHKLRGHGFHGCSCRALCPSLQHSAWHREARRVGQMMRIGGRSARSCWLPALGSDQGTHSSPFPGNSGDLEHEVTLTRPRGSCVAIPGSLGILEDLFSRLCFKCGYYNALWEKVLFCFFKLKQGQKQMMKMKERHQIQWNKGLFSDPLFLRQLALETCHSWIIRHEVHAYLMAARKCFVS